MSSLFGCIAIYPIVLHKGFIALLRCGVAVRCGRPRSAHLVTEVIAGGDVDELLQHKLLFHLPQGNGVLVLRLPIRGYLTESEGSRVCAESAQIWQHEVQLLLCLLLPEQWGQQRRLSRDTKLEEHIKQRQESTEHYKCWVHNSRKLNKIFNDRLVLNIFRIHLTHALKNIYYDDNDIKTNQYENIAQCTATVKFVVIHNHPAVSSYLITILNLNSSKLSENLNKKHP